jgi:predicted SAM-dependent methyltransferase
MKLNIGCGFLKMDGYVNIDNQSLCKPDILADLSKTWPWEDDTVDEIYAHHVMEHMGETFNDFLFIIKEMYRVSKDGAEWKIIVPHWQNDMFYHDPTHVRAISPVTFQMFDQKNNVHDFETYGHQTKLGLFNDVDVEVIGTQYILSQPWDGQKKEGKMTDNDIGFVAANYNNVIHEIQMTIKTHKPQRYKCWMEENIDRLYKK